MNILFIRVSSIGDVIHTLPCVFLIKQVCPRAHISWVVQHKAAHLLFDQPFLDNVWVLPDKFLYPRNWKKTWAVISQMRSIRWDAILDFQGLLKTAALHVGLKGPTYGFDAAHAREGITAWLTSKQMHPCYDNIVQKNLSLTSFMLDDLVRPKALPSTDRLQKACRLFFPEPSRAMVDLWLYARGASKIIFLAPNTTWPSKRWPDQHWQLLVRMLAQRQRVSPEDFSVVLVGAGFGQQSRNLVKLIEQEGLRVLVAPRWDLLATAYLITKSRVVVAPDTGLLHLADFLGVLSVGIFGPTSVDLHGAFWVPANKRNAFQVDCPHHYQKTHGRKQEKSAQQNCMFKLTPEMVYTRILKCL